MSFAFCVGHQIKSEIKYCDGYQFCHFQRNFSINYRKIEKILENQPLLQIFDPKLCNKKIVNAATPPNYSGFSIQLKFSKIQQWVN